MLPDLRYIVADRKNLVGLVLTHAHEDHIGAVLDLWPSIECPDFRDAIHGRHGQNEGRRGGQDGAAYPRNSARRDGSKPASSTSNSSVSRILSRSPTGSPSVRLRASYFTPATGSSIATPVVGKAHDVARLQSLGDEGVLAIVGNSTNAMREGRSASEADVAQNPRRRSSRCAALCRRHAVCFERRADRSVAEAAHKSGRTLVVAGRALHRIIEVAIETGYLPENFTYLDQQRFQDLPRNKVRRSLHRQPGRKSRAPSHALPRTSILTSRSIRAI